MIHCTHSPLTGRTGGIITARTRRGCIARSHQPTSPSRTAKVLVQHGIERYQTGSRISIRGIICLRLVAPDRGSFRWPRSGTTRGLTRGTTCGRRGVHRQVDQQQRRRSLRPGRARCCGTSCGFFRWSANGTSSRSFRWSFHPTRRRIRRVVVVVVVVVGQVFWRVIRSIPWIVVGLPLLLSVGGGRAVVGLLFRLLLLSPRCCDWIVMNYDEL